MSTQKAPRYPVPVLTGKPTSPLVNPLHTKALPLFAVWLDSAGFVPGPPFLRLALWPDGRVVFARDPNVWSQDLYLGQLAPPALSQLKTALRKTGVFELKGNCYLVPDGHVECVLLSFDGAAQMLYWDEVESPSYGINIDPKPQHLAFKKAWWDVNQLAIAALPTKAQKLTTPFVAAPRTWYLKKRIQSG